MDMGHGKMRDFYKSVMDTPPLLSVEVYPTSKAPILTASSLKPVLCKWGFDSYGKNGLLINARAETVVEKQMFREDFMQRRCVIPCNGFYEWDSAKNKYYFSRADGKLLYLAGFCHENDDDRRFIVLTKKATAPVSQFHHRIPVMIEMESIDDYLNDAKFATDAIALDSNIELIYT